MEKKEFEFSGSITQNNLQGNNEVKFSIKGDGKINTDSENDQKKDKNKRSEK